jgi:hypothetical protein
VGPILDRPFKVIHLAKMAPDAMASGAGVTLGCEVNMIRLLRVVIVAGAAVTFAACSEIGPTAPEAAPVAAGDVVILSAPVASASCTVTPNGAQYDVTVTWSAISITNIDLWQFGGFQPLSQTVLDHPRRNGTVTLTLSTAPDYALLTGRQSGLRQLCVTVISGG